MEELRKTKQTIILFRSHQEGKIIINAIISTYVGSRIWSESDNHIHCHSSHDVDPWYNTLYHECSHHSDPCDSFCALEAKVKE